MPKQAGESTRKMAADRRRTTLYIVIGIIAVTIILSVAINKWQSLGLGGGTVLVMLIILKIMPDLIDKPLKKRRQLEKRAIRGAAGEEAVGQILETLGENFYVIHDVNSPYGNIDHIVIGHHTGIFLIETKAHGGKIDLSTGELLLNGKSPEKDFIAQALKNTYWLRDIVAGFIGLKPWIKPVLVFTNAFVPFGKPIKGVNVINKKFLISFLQQQKNTDPTTEQIWDAREEMANQLMSE